jgi:DNA-binding NarL/FixJ family response regulator
VKIVLVGLPPMLRELVEAAVADQPDIETVGEVDDANGLEEVIARTGARAVVAADDALDETLALRVVGRSAHSHRELERRRPPRLRL